MLRSRFGYVLILLLLSSSAALAQSAPDKPVSAQAILPSHESVPNLGKLKTRLTAYHACQTANCYEPELSRQSDLAIAILQKRVAQKKEGARLALILDIDETALSNWTEITQDDYGYLSKDWNAWVLTGQAPAIAGVLRLFDEASKLGVSVFFISGRGLDQQAATEANLKSAGYHDWAGLALRGPHLSTQTTIDFKSGERQKVVDAGYTLILNVGDQLSDLKGTPRAEKSIKLPNPFYYIP